MPPLKFCANLSWLFTELPEFAQRAQAAAAAGFRAVEAAWLYDANPLDLQKASTQAGVDVVLINTPPGDVGKGDLGLGAVPGREEDFRAGLDLAVKYARALDCDRIHLMAGRVPAGQDRAAAAGEMEATFIANLRYAADVLSKEGILGLVEPINTRITDPRYFLNSPHQAAAILQKVGRSNIKLQMDIFHWQIMDGNLTQNIKTYFPLVGKYICFSLIHTNAMGDAGAFSGHIQIAQVPGRNEPDSPGEVNYPYVFGVLEEMGYQGYIGCEYRPKGELA
ncbi:HYI isomerase, partial [Atractosteus spatula]|nr:HYI isomerase [Atractosteus spatula]